MKPMTKWERIEATLRGDPVDRVPLSLWKHYHLRDRAPGQLAETTLTLSQQFDLDLIKLTPSGLYPIQDWGATIRFGRDDDTAPTPTQPVITHPADWATLPELDVHQGALQRELELIAQVAATLDGSVPFMMTLFSPLTIAYKLCQGAAEADQLLTHLRRHPDQLHAGLATISRVVRRYAAACSDAGAPGFFFATQLARDDRLSRAEYEAFGLAYDLPILEALAGRSRITMLHLCGRNVMFELLAHYPVDVINWAAGDENIDLATARQILTDQGLVERVLAGGLSLETLLHGDEAAVRAEAQQAVEQAGRTRFILAPACVVRGPSPDANLAAARRATVG